MIAKPIIIWTRSRENWRDDQSLFFQAKNNHLLHIPCISHEFTSFDQPNDLFDAFLFTSSKAVEAFKKNIDSFTTTDWKSMLAFCHGPATSEAASNLGFKTKTFQIESSTELPAHIAKEKAKSLLWIRAESPANELRENFAKLGIHTVEIVGYKTKAQIDMEDEPFARAIALLNQNKRTISVCFASPSAVLGFLKVLEKVDPSVIPHFRPIVIGKTTHQATEKVFSHAYSQIGLSATIKIEQSPESTILSLANTANSHK